MLQSKAQRVLFEIKRRHAEGFPINSGACRGDWLYAAAVLSFGSWKNAVEAAGISYDNVKIRPMIDSELLEKLRQFTSGELVLSHSKRTNLMNAARNRFGSVNDAFLAAGLEPPERKIKWTKEHLAKEIKREHDSGLPINSMEIVKRKEALYQAARRSFGSWSNAVKMLLPDNRKPTRITPVNSKL